MQNSADQLRRQDMRILRAQHLVAAVMHKLNPYFDERQDRVRRDAYEALIELFHDEGVDVITDMTRADAGLPPRGPDGYTMEELVALEKRRIDILTAPIYATSPDGALMVFKPQA